MLVCWYICKMHRIPHDIAALCERISHCTYENLTKILRFAQSGSAERAQRLDDSHQNDLDQWMGGGTCFSITWHLYQELQRLGYAPRLLMGHKRRERNTHCALSLRLTPNCNATWDTTTLFFDPGYLIFDPLILPEANTTLSYPLKPNFVLLRRDGLDPRVLSLFTGSMNQPAKLRFEFPLEGVTELEFHEHWRASFHYEMMNYPVLNRLDREKGIQYYYQKGNLVTRTSEGSTLQKIDAKDQVEILSKVFHLEASLVQDALGTLHKLQ